MDLETASLLLAFAGAAHLIRLCNRTPHKPQTTHNQDRLFSVPIVKEHGAKFLELLFVAPCIHHIILTATKPSEPSMICPNPSQLDSKYFTWSTYTVVSLTIIYASATLRLLAFRTLGKNFTFQLAKPDQLITSGVYGYVQHPSYGPLFVLICATIMQFLPFDAGQGCFLPMEIVDLWPVWRWQFLGIAMLILGVGIFVRVRDEEAMLKETFGKQWVDWHRKTPRFIPFLC